MSQLLRNLYLVREEVAIQDYLLWVHPDVVLVLCLQAWNLIACDRIPDINRAFGVIKEDLVRFVIALINHEQLACSPLPSLLIPSQVIILNRHNLPLLQDFHDLQVLVSVVIYYFRSRLVSVEIFKGTYIVFAPIIFSSAL